MVIGSISRRQLLTDLCHHLMQHLNISLWITCMQNRCKFWAAELNLCQSNTNTGSNINILSLSFLQPCIWWIGDLFIRICREIRLLCLCLIVPLYQVFMLIIGHKMHCDQISQTSYYYKRLSLALMLLVLTQ